MVAAAPSHILVVDKLTVRFGSAAVVEDLTFAVTPGRTLAIVGESGSGKSVTALSILRLADIMGASYPTGAIRLCTAGGQLDLLRLTQKAMRTIRGREIAMIFQEPMTSLNPVFTVGDQIAESLILHKQLSHKASLA